MRRGGDAHNAAAVLVAVQERVEELVDIQRVEALGFKAKVQKAAAREERKDANVICHLLGPYKTRGIRAI
jgi:hypothetical protein